MEKDGIVEAKHSVEVAVSCPAEGNAVGRQIIFTDYVLDAAHVAQSERKSENRKHSNG